MKKGVFGAALGRVLTGIAVSADGETTLRLDFATGDPLYVGTTGDCCSESWWADIIGAASAYGQEIVGARELEMPQPGPDDNRTRQESDEVYGYELRTTTGTVTLAFRNSSNGYYGGDAFAMDTAVASVWQKISTNNWSS